MITIDMGIPGIIQELEGRGMTVPKIARAMDVSEGYVYKLRRGEEDNITLDVLDRLARVYGAPRSELLRRIDGEAHNRRSKGNSAA